MRILRKGCLESGLPQKVMRKWKACDIQMLCRFGLLTDIDLCRDCCGQRSLIGGARSFPFGRRNGVAVSCRRGSAMHTGYVVGHDPR